MNEINVMYASDENFAWIMATSIISLLKNNKYNKINIFIASQEITSESKIKIKTMVNKYSNVNLKIIEIPDLDMIAEMTIDIKRYSKSMFSRIMCDSLLPKSLSRIIYIDCDTIIMKDLLDLYNLDLKGKTIGAVNDCRNKKYNDNLGMQSESIYINSGVLLIDLKKYRKNNYEAFLIKKIIKHNGELEFPDNDIICRYLENDIKIIPPKYNATSVLFACNWNNLLKLRKPHKCFSNKEYVDAVNDPTIVHFTTCFLLPARPWYKNYRHKYANYFIKYKMNTPWKSKELLDYNPNFVKKLINFTIKILPENIVCTLAGILHAIIKPSIQRKVDTN